jgi:hypothetical protein
MEPFASPVIRAISKAEGTIEIEFSGIPSGRQASITGKGSLLDADWYAVLDFEVTNGMRTMSFPILPHMLAEFYRMSAR